MIGNKTSELRLPTSYGKILCRVSVAKSLIQNSQAMCAKAGIRTHKFVSNTKEVLKPIAPENRASGLKYLDLKFDQLPIERILGTMWIVSDSGLSFKINS